MIIIKKFEIIQKVIPHERLPFSGRGEKIRTSEINFHPQDGNSI